ncbi:response regulator receiver domain protein (CheY-like) [Methanospirillum hungatei JF-1]|jgi:CheY-like chemotaxis protein|uniref:Response regulator receiver domain protein (CheY-like) n=1 Tax=Methanospirillum hungatei JF-1 (strain ATCC 27890 / DSM 864 / NBRC 100397 / JF-1) TaxID=323259 RepID=Q2FTI1_METHJ|nr:response regulator [Methanospirillum hungatei]MBP7034501.1 response regulator [Methanospirillum sp.]OQA55819.1 MAG: transcriptional regulator NarL [Euryarchaeota archaeon ADurb.Bin294]ABD42569.1 response regulator receiver domain protein (CheY-like) [Methanospirillum hungatei JF-1]MBP9007229.1 response regulator [Methanospirillum sp.]HOW03779.1 response regulator [Methanospirillum hungatei]
MEAKGERRLEILLIEDNQNDVELFLNVVDWINMGDQVRVFLDGREALDFLHGKGSYKEAPGSLPSVVFIDLKMPLISGHEVLKAIRKDKRTKTLPIVVFTSSDQEADIGETYKSGVNSYVVKPVQFEKYAETIRDLINYWRNVNTPPGSFRHDA